MNYKQKVEYWTPLHLEVFLWHAVCVEPYHRPSRAADDYLGEMVHHGLLTYKVVEDFGNIPVITDMGRVFLNALVSTPLPVQTWHMPEVDHE